jgi:hypothetical protein
VRGVRERAVHENNQRQKERKNGGNEKNRIVQNGYERDGEKSVNEEAEEWEI